MAITIKNSEVESLAREVSSRTGESITETIRKALEERRERIGFQASMRGKKDRILRYLEQEVWPAVPPDRIGKTISKEEEGEILGIGADGA